MCGSAQSTVLVALLAAATSRGVSRRQAPSSGVSTASTCSGVGVRALPRVPLPAAPEHQHGDAQQGDQQRRGAAEGHAGILTSGSSASGHAAGYGEEARSRARWTALAATVRVVEVVVSGLGSRSA